jgi:hypothetical protein
MFVSLIGQAIIDCESIVPACRRPARPGLSAKQTSHELREFRKNDKQDRYRTDKTDKADTKALLFNSEATLVHLFYLLPLCVSCLFRVIG